MLEGISDKEIEKFTSDIDVRLNEFEKDLGKEKLAEVIRTGYDKILGKEYVGNFIARVYKKYKQIYGAEKIKGMDNAEYVREMIKFADTLSLNEIFDIPENDHLQIFQMWKYYVLHHALLIEEEPDTKKSNANYMMSFYCSSTDEGTQSKFAEKMELKEKDSLKGMNIHIPDEVADLLLHYRNRVHPVRLPNPVVFFDVKLVIEGMKVMGIYAVEMTDGSIEFSFLDENKLRCVAKSKEPSKKIVKILREFIYNFIDFSEGREIKFTPFPVSQKRNERRVANHRQPLPEYNVIYITGLLERNFKDYEEHKARGQNWGRWNVKRFWRYFWKRQRYQRLYQMWDAGILQRDTKREWKMENGVLALRIMEHERGKGDLREQVYVAK